MRVRRPGNVDDGAQRQAADDSDPLPQAAEGGRDRRSAQCADPASCSISIAAENFEVEVSDRLRARRLGGRLVGAYIAAGRRRSARVGARARARGTRAGFPTPLWALADSHRICRPRGARRDRRGRRLHLSRPADAGLLCQAGRREHHQIRHEPAAAVLRRADGLRRRGEHRLRLPRPPGRPVLPEVARRPAVLQALRREHLPQRPVQRRRRSRRSADPRGRGRARRSATRRACSAPTAPTSC